MKPNTNTDLAQSTSADNGAGFELVEYDNSLQRLGGDKELFLEFIEIFMNDSPKILDELSTAVESGDSAAVEKTAHALKGLMSNFGAKLCCESALNFEIAGRQQNLDSVKDQLPKLNDLYEKLCAELSSF
jgi:HPt (histidine-containing phosphotransfer) domain-containing protein